MGLLDRLRGRRQSEDALAQARAEAGPGAAEIATIAAPVTSETGQVIGAPIQQTGLGAAGAQIPGLENMGALGPMIQQAIASGQSQVVMPPQIAAYVENAEQMREDVLAVLAKHGVDATPGSAQAIPVANTELMKDMLAAMSKHGLGPNQVAPGGEPPPAPDPS